MLRDAAIAAIRTGVAFAATWLLVTLTGLGIALEPEFEVTLSAALFMVCMALYNFLVNLAERKLHPLFGLLLGVPKSPAYGEVGTQTPPPRSHTLVNDRGEAPLAVVGIVLAVLGLVLLILEGVGNPVVPLVWSIILIVLGLALFVFSGRSRRL